MYFVRSAQHCRNNVQLFNEIIIWPKSSITFIALKSRYQNSLVWSNASTSGCLCLVIVCNPHRGSHVQFILLFFSACFAKVDCVCRVPCRKSAHPRPRSLRLLCYITRCTTYSIKFTATPHKGIKERHKKDVLHHAFFANDRSARISKA